jgi:nitrogen fixation protein FixH
MNPAAPPPRFVIKGWHVLVGFVLFFGADIAVNAAFMVSAYRTFPGETSVTPYEDGVAYNATLAQQRAQAALGWRMTAGFGPGGDVRIQAFDRAGAPLSGLRMSGRLQRPATETGARALSFSAAEPGLYVASTAPLAGAWDLDVTARDGQGHTMVAERRLIRP